MREPDESAIEIVRKATRELAGKFDRDCWRQKDRLGEHPWEFVNALAEGGQVSPTGE